MAYLSVIHSKIKVQVALKVADVYFNSMTYFTMFVKGVLAKCPESAFPKVWPSAADVDYYLLSCLCIV